MEGAACSSLIQPDLSTQTHTHSSIVTAATLSSLTTIVDITTRLYCPGCSANAKVKRKGCSRRLGDWEIKMKFPNSKTYIISIKTSDTITESPQNLVWIQWENRTNTQVWCDGKRERALVSPSSLQKKNCGGRRAPEFNKNKQNQEDSTTTTSAERVCLACKNARVSIDSRQESRKRKESDGDTNSSSFASTINEIWPLQLPRLGCLHEKSYWYGPMNGAAMTCSRGTDLKIMVMDPEKETIDGRPRWCAHCCALGGHLIALGSQVHLPLQFQFDFFNSYRLIKVSLLSFLPPCLQWIGPYIIGTGQFTGQGHGRAVSQNQNKFTRGRSLAVCWSYSASHAQTHKHAASEYSESALTIQSTWNKRRVTARCLHSKGNQSKRWKSAINFHWLCCIGIGFKIILQAIQKLESNGL